MRISTDLHIMELFSLVQSDRVWFFPLLDSQTVFSHVKWLDKAYDYAKLSFWKKEKKKKKGFVFFFFKSKSWMNTSSSDINVKEPLQISPLHIEIKKFWKFFDTFVKKSYFVFPSILPEKSQNHDWNVQGALKYLNVLS